MLRLSDRSDRSSSDPFILVLRAAFVADGEQPPPDFASDFSPLKFRATLDRTTGTITCDSAGMNFDGDIRAEWHPDEGQEANATGDDDAQETGGKEGENDTRGQPRGQAGADGDAAARPNSARPSQPRETRSKRKYDVAVRGD